VSLGLFNVEAPLAAQMSPTAVVRPTGIFPGVPAGSPPLYPASYVSQFVICQNYFLFAKCNRPTAIPTFQLHLLPW